MLERKMTALPPFSIDGLEAARKRERIALKRVKAKLRVYKQCSKGKPVDCKDCIGCASHN